MAASVNPGSVINKGGDPEPGNGATGMTVWEYVGMGVCAYLLV